MWFMEIINNKNNYIGLHFSNRLEMFDWVSLYFKYYTFEYNFISIKIWYDKDKEDN